MAAAPCIFTRDNLTGVLPQCACSSVSVGDSARLPCPLADRLQLAQGSHKLQSSPEPCILSCTQRHLVSMICHENCMRIQPCSLLNDQSLNALPTLSRHMFHPCIPTRCCMVSNVPHLLHPRESSELDHRINAGGVLSGSSCGSQGPQPATPYFAWR